MTAQSCLSGIVVVERGGRLATAICGNLLADLGATVVRIETGRTHSGLGETAQRRADAIARLGKAALRLDLASPDDAALWRRFVDQADILVLTPDGPEDDRLVQLESKKRVVCVVTTAGLDAPADETSQWGELALQAMGGIMACTGREGGAPEWVHVPIVEMMTGLNAAAACVAALRHGERHGTFQLAEVAALDSQIALFATFISNVAEGKRDGYRLGCRHHLCAPWNAYPSADGWIQLCLAGDAQWRTLLTRIGRQDLVDEPRYASNAMRVRHAAEIDAMISEWTRQRGSADVVATLHAAGLPVGHIRRLADLIADDEFLARGMVGAVESDGERTARPNSFFRMSVSPGRIAEDAPAAEGVLASLEAAPQKKRPTGVAGERPLSGIRVLELGSYTAGPLAGRYLAELGAEVIKIEAPGGEVSRAWVPQFDGHGGYFANCNVGKKFIVFDLKDPADRDQFLTLAQSADVLLENLRPGALDKLGLGQDQVARLAPRLVYCSLSGFGHTATPRPALDTIVQAEGGLMWLVGPLDRPQRVGTSVADQAIAHAAPLAIIAALRYRDLSGCGQHIDLAMRDVVAWLTQLAWPDGRTAVAPWAQAATKDGWVLGDCSEETLHAILGPEAETETRSQAVERLKQANIDAVPILEMGEVFDQPAVVRRNLVQWAEPEGARVPVLSAPYRFAGRPLEIGKLPGPADGDRDILLPCQPPHGGIVASR